MATTKNLTAQYIIDDDCPEFDKEIRDEIANQLTKEIDNDFVFSLRAMWCSSEDEVFDLCDQFDRSLSDFLREKEQTTKDDLYHRIKAYTELGGK